MKIHIYKIYFPTSERFNPYYVGVTENLEDRMSRHLRSKFLVGLALNKYSDWTIEILHTTKDKDAAKLLEIEEIRHFNCVAPNGYNLTRGGDGVDGYKHTEEAKEKMRDHKWSEKSKRKIKGKSNIKGHHHTEEAREKIRQANLGNKNPMKNPVTNLKRQISFIKNQLAKLENE